MVKIRTISEVIAVLTGMKGNITTYQIQVGATALDIDFINDALENLEYLVSYCAAVDDAKRGVFQIKDTALNGEMSEVIGPFPVFAAGVVPDPPLLAGYLERLLILIRRFKLGPGYNHDIGVALGFETSEPEAPTNPATVVPTVEATAAQTGYLASFVVGNRADSDMYEVWSSPASAPNWTILITANGKSTDAVFTPTTPGQPQQFMIRIQLKKNNQNYGQLSAVIYVTVNP